MLSVKISFCLALPVFLSAILCQSCLSKSDAPFALDTSEPLALAPDVSWIVIKEPYAALMESAGWDSHASGYCHRGEIFQMLGCKTLAADNTAEKWYRVAGGWVSEHFVSTCANKFNAKSLADSL